jgi:hypothetical protein
MNCRTGDSLAQEQATANGKEQVLRALYVLQGDTAKARAAYHDFVTLRKDADTDIPILIAAKAEYDKLKYPIWFSKLRGQSFGDAISLAADSTGGGVQGRTVWEGGDVRQSFQVPCECVCRVLRK